MLEIIWMELISWHHNNSLARYFGINKTRELIDWKYHWPSFQKVVKAYIKGCNAYLGLKTVKHKFYIDLQLLPVLIHQWKKLSIDFVIKLSTLINWKGKMYDFILVIVNWLTKIGYYKPGKITINILGLAEVILDTVVWHYGLFNLIVSDKSSLFISKFLLLLCYFLNIKWRLLITFYS